MAQGLTGKLTYHAMIYAIFHKIPDLAKRASFTPLLEIMDCRVVSYHCIWVALQKRSWRMGQYLRNWGNKYYGSTWNWFIPFVHEWVLSRKSRAGKGDVIHFMMGEFGSPRHAGWFSRRGAKLVATFHCSARRLDQVLGNYRCLFAFDRISVMSKTQIPFFVDRGYSADRIDVTLHGVDTDYFCPAAEPRQLSPGGVLRLLLVGSTERDHEFAAEVMCRLKDAPVELDVLTSPVNLKHYEELSNVTCLNDVSDSQLIEAYQNADLLFMPVLDCTANNSVLEAMSCGTPVMVNRAGGMPEYVDASCNIMLDEKNADVWTDKLIYLSRNREELESLRPGVRAWAEQLDWRVLKSQYLRFYEEAIRNSEHS